MTGSRQLAGRYQLGELLGRGRTRRTYVATDRVLAREVVVVVSEHVGASAPTRVLTHPGLVTVLDVGADGGLPFVVTELVRGRSLAATATAPLDVARLMVVGALVADALAHAHALGVAHGSLSGDDVLLGPDGRVKLAGLGLGAPGDASPEDDVRALGAVLLETLAVLPEPTPDHLLRLLGAMTSDAPDARPRATEVAFQLRRPTGPPRLRDRTVVRLPAIADVPAEEPAEVHEPAPVSTMGVVDVRRRLGGVGQHHWGIGGAGLVLVALLLVAALAR